MPKVSGLVLLVPFWREKRERKKKNDMVASKAFADLRITLFRSLLTLAKETDQQGFHQDNLGGSYMWEAEQQFQNCSGSAVK